MAALRLLPSADFASAAFARQTMHQQLFGPPRAANSCSKSPQLRRSTSRKASLGDDMGSIARLQPNYGSLSYPSPSPFRLSGKPMPSSGVSKMMKVAVLAVRS